MSLKLIKSNYSNYCWWNSWKNEGTAFIFLDTRRKFFYSSNIDLANFMKEDEVDGHLLRFEINNLLSTKKINELLEELFCYAEILFRESSQVVIREDEESYRLKTVYSTPACDSALRIIDASCMHTFYCNDYEDYLYILDPEGTKWLDCWVWEKGSSLQEACKSYEKYLRSCFSQEVEFDNDIEHSLQYFKNEGYFDDCDEPENNF